MSEQFFDITENLEAEGSDEVLENPTDEPVDADMQDDAPAEEDGGNGDDLDGSTEEDGKGAADKLWAGKYKTPEDLEQAYLNSQRSATKLAQELAQLRKTASAPPEGNEHNPTQTPEFAQIAQINPQLALQMLTQKAAQDAVRQHVMPLQEKLDSVTMQAELARLKAMHSDFGEVAPHMAEVFKDNPDLWNTKEPLRVAYALAKAEYAEEAVAAAKEAGRKEAYRSKANKQSAVVEGQKSKGQQKQKTPEEDMLDEIFSPRGGSVFF